MKAYSELLVKTCHRRGAHAMGGMAALIPSRKDPEANERAISAVAADKEREAASGFDGTWVAHPDVVRDRDGPSSTRSSAIAPTRSTASATTSTSAPPSCSTSPPRRAPSPRPGCATTSTSGIQYISSWLRGNGAAGIYGLMEDAATAEISRSQVWQWIRHGRTLEDDGTPITAELVRRLEGEELERIRSEIGDDEWFEREGRPRSRARSSSRSRWPTSSPSSSPSRPTSSSTRRVGPFARRHRRGPRDRPRDRRAAAGRRRQRRGDRARPGRAGWLDGRPRAIAVVGDAERRGGHRAGGRRRAGRGAARGLGQQRRGLPRRLDRLGVHARAARPHQREPRARRRRLRDGRPPLPGRRARRERSSTSPPTRRASPCRAARPT